MEDSNQNSYAMLETMQCIGSETAGAERVRKYRETQKALHCNNAVTACNTEKEIDIELDTEKEIDKNITTTTIEEEERAVDFSTMQYTNLSTVMCGQVQTTVDNLKLVKETIAELAAHYWHRERSNRDVEIAFEKLCSYVVTDDTVIGVFDEENAGLLKSAEYLGCKTVKRVPLVVDKACCLLPVKARDSFSKNHGNMGYVVMEYVYSAEETDGKTNDRARWR